MRILGMHWAWHLLYLLILSGGFYGAKNKLEQYAFLKSEIAQVQPLAISAIPNWKYAQNIWQETQMLRSLKNTNNHRISTQAQQLVDVFGSACDQARQYLQIKNKAQIKYSPASLAQEYYLLGDSLKSIFPHNTADSSWFERCLSADYVDYPPDRLAILLTDPDSTAALMIIQNLHLKAVLALHAGLAALQDQMEERPYYGFDFDALLPVLSYEQCPQAGQLFEADINLAPYSTTDNRLDIMINGQWMPKEKGLIHYNSTGSEPVRLEMLEENPWNGTSFIRQFFGN